MVSLLKSVGDPQMKPLTNIGFPFTYYYQFWTRGADSPNCGWNLTYFIYDATIVWVIVLIGYFYMSKVSTKNNDHVN